MDDSEPMLDDSSHQGCYVFQPSSATGVDNDDADADIDQRPRKRQKAHRRQPAADASPTTDEWQWPRLCAGTEPEELATFRQHTYQRLWHEVEERIDAVIDAVDDRALAKIRHFVCSDSGSSQGRRQLTTALLLSGAHDGRRRIHQLLRHWRESQAETVPESEQGEGENEKEILVQLSTHQCPNLPTALKTLIRLAIDDDNDYTTLLAAHKRLIPMPFDLELLQRYLDNHNVKAVVVALPEVESFDISIVAELIHHLSLWSDRIPLSLVLGISTTVDLFESCLPKATIRLLSPRSFSLTDQADAETGTDSDPLYSILLAVHHNHSPSSSEGDNAASLFLGPAVLNFLSESAHDNQTTTPSALKRIIKYAFMSHFFANPLSVLLYAYSDESETMLSLPANQAFLASLLRNTPSFRAYCADLIGLKSKEAAERVRQLVTSDADMLDDAISSVTASRAHLLSASAAIDMFVRLYNHPALNLNKNNSPPIPPSELYVQLLSQHVLPDPKSAAKSKAIAIAKPVKSTSLYSDLISALRLLPSEKLSELVTDMELSTTSSTEVVDYLEKLFSNSICYPPTPPPAPPALQLLWSEVYTFNLRHPLQPTFAPQPRHAIERALSRPSDYLGCECCSTATDAGAGRPEGSILAKEPTSLLYTLLNEAGKHVNLRDLWDIFASSLSQQRGSGSHEGEAEVEAEADDSEHNTRHLTLFYRGLAELKMLGLIQQHSSSSSTATATTTSSRVDLIARSTWIGL